MSSTVLLGAHCWRKRAVGCGLRELTASVLLFVLSLVLRVGELALPQFLSLAAMHATPAMLPHVRNHKPKHILPFVSCLGHGVYPGNRKIIIQRFQGCLEVMRLGYLVC